MGISAVVSLQDKEDTTIPAMLRQLSECEKAIENLLNAIQAGALTPSTTQRLKKLEDEKEKLNIAICEAELKLPKFSKENVKQWISNFKYGDPTDKDYQRRIIDTFVNSVYIYDDRIVLTYNFKDGSSTLILKEIKKNFCSDLKNSTPPPKRIGNDPLFHWNFNVFLVWWCNQKCNHFWYRIISYLLSLKYRNIVDR